MQKIKIWYLASPLLFAVFNVLFLYSHNIDLVGTMEIVRPLLVVLGGSIVTLLVLTGIFREKGPLLSVIVLSFIFLFGHMERIEKTWGGELTLHVFRQLWFVFFFVIFLLVFLKIQKTDNVMKIITFVFAVMICVTLTNIAVFNIRNMEIEKAEPVATAGSKFDTSRLPDIYYIVLDAYARGDTLKDLYGYDNSDLLNYLRQKGFYIPEKSVSNYCHTILCLASALNMTHLDRLAEIVRIKNNSRGPLIKMILNNKVQHIFKNLGYTTVGVHSDCAYANLAYADIFFGDKQTPIMTEFETILYNTTVFSYLEIVLASIRPKEDRYVLHKNRILHSFERLGKIPEIKKPTFTFSHLFCPHPPFIFEENGEISKTEQQHPFTFFDNTAYLDERKVDSREYRRRYNKQITYLNKLIKKTVDEILSSSDIPPIIILQADHGPGSEINLGDYSQNKNINERFATFNAFHFPGGGDKMLYDTISSVNVFRAVLNYYFGMDYPFLEDRSYYSTWDNRYDFIEVTKELK